MSLSRDLEEFVRAHRPCGQGTWQTGPPTPNGYQVQVACPCGVTFERWVLPWDAAEDLLAEGLKAARVWQLRNGSPPLLTGSIPFHEDDPPGLVDYEKRGVAR